MCMIDYAERCTVLSDTEPTARKAHRCDECHRIIEPGEKYKNESLLMDGQASTHKTCRHCLRVREWLCDECGGWVYGGVEEDIREHSWEGYGVAVKMMAAGMERKWKRRDGRMWRLPSLPKVSGHAAA